MFNIFANILKYIFGGLVTALAGFIIMGQKADLHEIGLLGIAGAILYMTFDMNCAIKNNESAPVSNKTK
jgi:zinc transporter ZupT